MSSKNLNNIMLLLAWESIAHGLKTGKPLSIDVDDYPIELAEPKPCFVLLKQKQAVRGCVGSIEPIRPLGEDLVENAFAAAFCDRHFMPLSDNELDQTQINILLISPLQALSCDSQMTLIEQLQPRVDGLLIRDGSHHASLLPAAWETFKTPMEFVNQLKRQAGLPMTYWSKNTQIFRFSTETIASPTSDNHTH